jgi:hypothetical protein
MGSDEFSRVREHLRPGEVPHAAIWASRADRQEPIPLTRAAMSPFRFRRRERGGHSAAEGDPRGLAVGLEQHLRLVTEPRLLARTDQRLLVLAERRTLFGGRGSALRLRWECPAGSLASAADQDGRLRLTFTDGSALTLLTPAAQLQPFLL